MADQEAPDVSTSVVEAVIEPPEPPAKKREPAVKAEAKAKTKSIKSTAKEAVLAEIPAKRRRFSQAERADKLAAIDADITKGATLKAAVKSAGVSEQTYYQWKKAANTPETAKPTSESIAFADLIELEADNQRLRVQLANKLRAENEELRKRLDRGDRKSVV